MVRQRSMLLTLIALVMWSASAPVAAFSQTLAQLVDGAKKEGSMVLNWGTGTLGGIDGAKLLEQGFNRQYGLNLQFKFTPGPAMPQLASRIIQEAKANQPASTDLFVGSENHVARMALKRVEWTKVFAHVTAPMVDYDNRVIVVTSRTPGFTYNTSLISANETPQKVEDVLNPKWKGKIASTPYAASFDRLGLIWGEEKTTAFLQKFVKHVAGLIRCGEDERIATGEFALLVFNCDLASAMEMRERGGPVQGQVFKDAGILSYWYLSVPANARNPNAATLLAGFLLSKEGQEIVFKMDKGSSHFVEGTQMNKYVKEQEQRGVKFHSTTVVEVVKHQEEHSRLRQKFQNILQGK